MNKMTELLRKLTSWGADPQEAIDRRMLGDENLYLKLLLGLRSNGDMEAFSHLIKKQKYAEAFRMIHRIKGSAATLSLYPLQEEIQALTELLRPYYEKDEEQYAAEDLIDEAYEKLREKWSLFCSITSLREETP